MAAQAKGRETQRDGAALLEVHDVTKVFSRGKRKVTALEDISLTASEGEFVTIIGPSGCGKSTLLHMMGGFEQPSSGSVTLHGKAVTEPGRDRGMVFQQATLYPWWTIERNVGWPVEVGGGGPPEGEGPGVGAVGAGGARRLRRRVSERAVGRHAAGGPRWPAPWRSSRTCS